MYKKYKFLLCSEVAPHNVILSYVMFLDWGCSTAAFMCMLTCTAVDVEHWAPLTTLCTVG